MRLRNEVKVGLIVFVAFVGLMAAYWFLGGFGLRTSTYPIYAIFPNAQKLDQGADIRMAGVKIGIVEGIQLTKGNKARVDLLIWNNVKIPTNSGAQITTGGVIGDNFIEVVPGTSTRALKKNEQICTLQIVQFDEIMQDAGALLKELKISATSVNTILGDKQMIANIKDTMKSLQQSAASAQQIMASAQGLVSQASPDIRQAFANLTKATDNAIQIGDQLEDMVAKDVRPNVRGMMKQAELVAKNLNDAITQTGELIGSFKGSSAKVEQTLDKVTATAGQAEEMMANLNKASAGIKDIATDPEIKSNLKATVRNTAEATQGANALICNLNQKLSGFGIGPTVTNKAAIPDYGISGNALWNAGTGEPRFDANYTFAWSDEAFYRLGLYDISSGTKVNLQAGKVLDQANALRYGLYASELGVGYDWRPASAFRISADIFNPDDPEVELRGILKVRGPFGLYAGMRNTLGEGDTDLILGVHYNK